jgi:phage/plasmid-associated DNA primase
MSEATSCPKPEESSCPKFTALVAEMFENDPKKIKVAQEWIGSLLMDGPLCPPEFSK